MPKQAEELTTNPMLLILGVTIQFYKEHACVLFIKSIMEK